MSFTAAASGFLVFLLSVSVVQGQDDWGVTYTSTEICALKGSTVDIRCTYRYPAYLDDLTVTVEKTLWFTKQEGDEPVDLKTDLDYEGRVEYHGDQKNCSLRIKDLRETDSAVYKFRFITNHPTGSYTASSGVTLTVTGVHDQTCNRVTYTDRSICALKGSSVDISCTYSSYDNYVESEFWFSPKHSHQWQDSSQPEDFSWDSEYAGRVQQFEAESGGSTLRITDLRESDSAEYRFKFQTQWFEWGNDFPGTTLTVTDLQVQVTRPSVHQFSTQAELKCHSSCRLAGHPSYVWYKNGQTFKEETSSSYTGNFYPDDSYSCAVKGHEDLHSPPVYAPKVPSVLVRPSGETVEGSSVTLTCSSDANPAATYTWYKENGNPDHKPLKTGPQLDFISIQSSDSGEYYCAAENALGGNRSASISINVKWKGTIYMNAARLTLIVLILITVFLLYLWIRKKKTLNSTTEPSDPVQTVQSDSDPEYENLTAAQTEATEEQEDLV
ncbi:sialoadhesin-like [Centroberyx affinis]|uniref:sialoadhesin-like n=1 Tax=Centroberyx affinis TaxID=166261 RepID=UPI003A5C1287